MHYHSTLLCKNTTRCTFINGFFTVHSCLVCRLCELTIRLVSSRVPVFYTFTKLTLYNFLYTKRINEIGKLIVLPGASQHRFRPSHCEGDTRNMLSVFLIILITLRRPTQNCLPPSFSHTRACAFGVTLVVKEVLPSELSERKPTGSKERWLRPGFDSYRGSRKLNLY